MISRRMLLRSLAASAAGVSASGWFSSFAKRATAATDRSRNCILLWMAGGPAQTDTFDLKPNHENGGEFQEISTSVPGIRFSEHLPQLAQQADQLAILRGVSTKEGDHGRGTYLMRTGQRPLSPIEYPPIGASLASQKAAAVLDSGLPPYVSVAAAPAVNADAFAPGFLGPRYGPLFVAGGAGAANPVVAPAANAAAPNAAAYPPLEVASLDRIQGISATRMERRLDLWRGLQQEFLGRYGEGAPRTQNAVYDSAIQLMDGVGAAAFDLSQEPDELRAAYGATVFGQGCLLARRLVERGVPFVEVTLDGWDTHVNNFDAVKRLSTTLDAGWATLMTDLESRGLLESTTILWMGEFGRTPRINQNAGRDHFPAAWSVALAGGGIRGGQVWGSTNEDGTRVSDGKVDVTDILATLCSAVGVPPETTHLSNTGRPVAIVDGLPVTELLS